MAEHIGCPLAPQGCVCLPGAKTFISINVLPYFIVALCVNIECLRAIICLCSKLLAMNSVETVYNAAWDSILLPLYCSTITEEGSLGPDVAMG